jgi:hypothetical protein
MLTCSHLSHLVQPCFERSLWELPAVMPALPPIGFCLRSSKRSTLVLTPSVLGSRRQALTKYKYFFQGLFLELLT